jgi:hypothetical protein
VRTALLGNVHWSGERGAELAVMGDVLAQQGRAPIGFSGELLTADARAQGALIVDPSRGTRLSGSGSELGQNTCVTEFGNSFAVDGLQIAGVGTDRPGYRPGPDPSYSNRRGGDPQTGRRL